MRKEICYLSHSVCGGFYGGWSKLIQAYKVLLISSFVAGSGWTWRWQLPPVFWENLVWPFPGSGKLVNFSVLCVFSSLTLNLRITVVRVFCGGWKHVLDSIQDWAHRRWSINIRRFPLLHRLYFVQYLVITPVFLLHFNCIYTVYFSYFFLINRQGRD